MNTICRYKGRAVETGEEITGYAVECRGQVNPGQIFICPDATTVAYHDDGSKDAHFELGWFIQVDPKTVELVF